MPPVILQMGIHEVAMAGMKWQCWRDRNNMLFAAFRKRRKLLKTRQEKLHKHLASRLILRLPLLTSTLRYIAACMCTYLQQH